MRHRYAHVLAAIFNRPWAIEPRMLGVMADLVLLRARGDRLSEDEIEARVGAAQLSAGERIGRMDVGTTAIIPLYGVIGPRMNLMMAYSGGTSLDELRGAITEALADESVRSIVLDVDSPGGSVEGLAEFAAFLRAARDSGGKPIYAVANYTAASAAAYIAAQATEFYAAPSAWVGSIGTVAMHTEYSRADEMEGVKHTLIASDAKKVEQNPYEPLSDEGRGQIEATVQHYYAMFVADMAKGRNTTTAKVREEFGGGRMLFPAEAQAAGLIDGITTLEALVQRLNRPSSRSRASGLRAEDESALITDSADDSVEPLAALPDIALEETDPDPQQTPSSESDADATGDAIPEHVLAAIAADKRTPAERLAAWGASASSRRSH